MSETEGRRDGGDGMTGRLRYPEVAPEGYAALGAFGHYVNAGTALEPVLLGYVYLRASVLNGCEFCTQLHRAELRKHHEPESRMRAAAEVPGAEEFTPRELAALRWTDALTRLGSGGATDAEYAAVSAFFQGKDLVDLTFAIANINAWNRMGVAFRPEWRPRGAQAVQNGVQDAAGGSQSRAEMEAQKHRQMGPMTPHPEKVEDDGGKVATD